MNLEPEPASEPTVGASCPPTDLAASSAGSQQPQARALCPVQVVGASVDRTVSCRRSHQLLVLWVRVSGPSGHQCCSQLVLPALFRPVVHAGRVHSVQVCCPDWVGAHLVVGGRLLSLSANTEAAIAHSETWSQR